LAAQKSQLEQKAQQAAGDEARFKRQAKDLSTLVNENEELRLRLREVSSSMQLMKQENEQITIENRSLLESVCNLSGDLDEVTGRHAEMIGHKNPKQRIRYTVKLKEECQQVRHELFKARSRIGQLEQNSRRSDNLFGALTALGYHPVAAEDRRRSRGEEPGASPSASPQAAPSEGKQARIAPRRLVGPANGAARPNGKDAELEEANRRIRIQDSALERVDSDFRHLVALIQRVVAGEELQHVAAEEVIRSSEEGPMHFQILLEKLRQVMTAQMKPAGKAPAPAKCELKELKEPTTPQHRLSDRARNAEVMQASPLDLSGDGKRLSDVQAHSPLSLPGGKENAKEESELTHVIKQINDALSNGTRLLYGQPIKDPASFFKVLDKSGSGSLDRQEIAQGLKRLDVVLTAPMLDALVKAVDADENGRIDLEELLRALDLSTAPFKASKKTSPRPSPKKLTPARV